MFAYVPFVIYISDVTDLFFFLFFMCFSFLFMAVIHHASSQGVTIFNSATFYGPLHVEGYGANLRLIKKCLVGLDRSSIQLMVKIGMDTRAPMDKPGSKFQMSGTLDHLRADVDFALEQLGVEYIDIIVLCRVPTDVTIEEAVQNMQVLVSEGKARHIALSEASPATIRRAHAVVPIYAIEQEWSLWSRDIEEEILPTCRELGIKIVAYSPLGRGFLTGSIRSAADLDPSDFRAVAQPKFSGENLQANVELVNRVQAVADRKGITVGQLALAWLHSQGPDVIPIPGTSSIAHLNQNLAAREVVLSDEDKEEINAIFGVGAAAGDRYAHAALTFKGNA